MLDNIEKNLAAIDMLESILTEPEGISATELMLNLKNGCFNDCQWLVPLLLLSSTDHAINFTFQRLYYTLYANELERVGAELLSARIADMLAEERAKCSAVASN